MVIICNYLVPTWILLKSIVLVYLSLRDREQIMSVRVEHTVLEDRICDISINTLLGVLNRLVDKGNTVLVIEHNLDVLKCADHIIDMGPEGGKNGGQIIACGTPEEIAQSNSPTSKYLAEELS